MRQSRKVSDMNVVKVLGCIGTAIAFLFGVYRFWIVPRTKYCAEATHLAAIIAQQTPAADGSSPERKELRALYRGDLVLTFGKSSEVVRATGKFVGLMDSKEPGETWPGAAGARLEQMVISAGDIATACRCAEWVPWR